MPISKEKADQVISESQTASVLAREAKDSAEKTGSKVDLLSEAVTESISSFGKCTAAILELTGELKVINAERKYERKASDAVAEDVKRLVSKEKTYDDNDVIIKKVQRKLAATVITMCLSMSAIVAVCANLMKA